MTDPAGTTAERRVAAENDIGPFYKTLGALLMLGLFAMVGFEVREHHKFEWPDVAIWAIVLLLELALIRPRKFDEAVKTVADKLPFTKFQKPDGT